LNSMPQWLPSVMPDQRTIVCAMNYTIVLHRVHWMHIPPHLRVPLICLKSISLPAIMITTVITITTATQARAMPTMPTTTTFPTTMIATITTIMVTVIKATMPAVEMVVVATKVISFQSRRLQVMKHLLMHQAMTQLVMRCVLLTTMHVCRNIFMETICSTILHQWPLLSRTGQS